MVQNYILAKMCLWLIKVEAEDAKTETAESRFTRNKLTLTLFHKAVALLQIFIFCYPRVKANIL